MKIEDTLTTSDVFRADLNTIKECFYDKCNFNLTSLKWNPESEEYGACSFVLDGKMIQYRVSKITPTKSGQFVTTWKRNKDGVTEPFSISDEIDFLIITSRKDDNLGQFIFSKSVLADNGVLTSKTKEGKRGIRVYPPWDMPTNKQAERTQNWQTKCFVTLKGNEPTDLNVIQRILEP